MDVSRKKDEFFSVYLITWLICRRISSGFEFVRQDIIQEGHYSEACCVLLVPLPIGY